MIKRNRLRTKVLTALCGAAGLAAFGIIFSGSAKQWIWEHSGIPDAVSSISDGRDCRLTVVANADVIEDKEAFASDVARKYQENSFRTIRLSTDTGGEPSRVEIVVYLKRGDVGKEDPVMRICLEFPEQGNTGGNRGGQDEECRIYVDGRRIKTEQ